MGANWSHLNFREDNIGFPLEIGEHITQFLSNEDRLLCRRVCADWNSVIINNRMINPDMTFVVDCSEDAIQHLVCSHLSSRNWTSFKFKNLDLGRNPYTTLFWSRFGDKITRIEFVNCTLSPNGYAPQEGKLLCPNLRHLGLILCHKNFMLGGKNFKLSSWLNLTNIETLDVSMNRMYMSDHILHGLLNSIRNLKSLNLSDCGMTFADAIFHRYYPKLSDAATSTDEVAFSEDVLTFQILRIFYLTTKRAKTLRDLSMANTRFNGEALLTMSNPKNYSWDSLCLNNCTEVSASALTKFLKLQKLTKFEMAFCGYNPSVMKEVLQNLESVKILILSNSGLCGVKVLTTLPNLSYLAVDETLLGFSQEWSFLEGMKKLKKLNLKRTFRSPYISTSQESAFSSILLNVLSAFTRLTELNLGEAGRAVTDDLIQAIIRNIRGLRKLSLHSARCITDLGLAGCFVDPQDEDLPASEITRQREKFMKWKMEGSIQGVCLSSLTSLRALNLEGCSGIGEATWELALNLPLLEALDVSNITVNSASLRKTLSNLRSLSYLRAFQNGVLSNHYREIETTVKEVLHLLPRLKFSKDKIWSSSFETKIA